jgi:predicted anti-sigma-YlaC factor YlaD
MKCRNIEKIIIESLENKIDLNADTGVKRHLEECPACMKFYETAEDLMNFGAESREVKVPENLERATLGECLEELQRGEDTAQNFVVRCKKIPAFILASVIIIVVLTFCWVFYAAILDSTDKSAAVQQTWALITVIQNFLMLLLTPLLIRNIKKKKDYNLLYQEVYFE